eukprot:c22100_g1_i1 orf=526-1419(+)
MESETSVSAYFPSLLTMPFARISSVDVDVSGRQNDKDDMKRSSPIRTKRKLKLQGGFPLSHWELVAVTSIFVLSFAVLVSIYFTMPNLSDGFFRFPRSLAELRLMKSHLSAYSEDYTAQVLLGFIAVYIFMQTFMIPGTIFFSLLAGALFGEYRGLILVVFSATAGASSCFFLSKLFGRPIVTWLWPEKIRFFQSQVAKHRGTLLNYMLFLRITPSLPNTFINLASPIVDVPYYIFFVATFFGLIPASFLTVRAGLTLGELESLGDLYDIRTVTLLFVVGLLFIIPTLMRRPKQIPL